MAFLRPTSPETVELIFRSMGSGKRLVVIGGSEGKSSALAGIADAVRGAAIVHTLRGTPTPFGALRPLLRALVQDDSDRTLGCDEGCHALFFDCEHGARDPQRVRDAIVELGLAAADRQAHALIVFDYDRLDPDSRHVMVDWLDARDTKHAFTVFTNGVSDALINHPRTTSLSLDRLDEAELRALLQSDDFVNHILERSQGSIEVIEQLLSASLSTREDITRRQLDCAARDAIETLAVIGPCTIDELRAASATKSVGLEELLATELVALDPEGVVVRSRAVLESLSATRQNELHARGEEVFRETRPIRAFMHARARGSFDVELTLRAADQCEREAAPARAIEILGDASPLQDARVTRRLVRALVEQGAYLDALPHARRVGDEKQLAEVLTQLGRYEEALEVLPREGDRRIDATRAELFFQLRDFASARAIAESLVNVRDVPALLALQTLAKLALYEHPTKAGDAYARYEEVARAIDHSEHTALAIGGRGIAALRLGDHEQAERLLLECANAIREDDPAGKKPRALAWHNLAVLSHLQHDYRRARVRYERALRCLKIAGHLGSLARCAINLGELYESMGAYDRAAVLCEQGTLAQTAPGGRAEALLLRGRIALAEGRLADAELALFAARERFVDVDRDRAEAAIIAIAELRRSQGRRDEALDELLHVTSPRRLADAAIVRAEITQDPLECASAISAADQHGDDRARLRARAATLTAPWAKNADRVAREAKEIEAAITRRMPSDLREKFLSLPASRSIAARDRVPDAPFVANAPAMRKVLSRIERVGPSDCSILVLGESGTGKELIADAIHASSGRTGQLVRVSCAALVESLLLSELFGHERGAFTGAVQRKRGRFELAHQGTLFLDEIGEISPRVQAALLRVLQEHAFQRVGGHETIEVDVRIVAATNRDLYAMVEAGTFREDLFYRLNTVAIELPPLRDRREDIAAIADAFLARQAAKSGAPASTLDPSALAALRAYHWPGNIRQLENVLRAASLFAPGAIIRAVDLDPKVHAASPMRNAPSEMPARATTPNYFDRLRDGELSMKELKKEIERACVARALTETDGNITRAATILGMKRPRLSQLVKEHGLRNEDSKT